MNWKFSFINPSVKDSKQSMDLTNVEAMVKTLNANGYELVNMLPYGAGQSLPSILLVFWRTAAGPCPMMPPMTAARNVELDVS